MIVQETLKALYVVKLVKRLSIAEILEILNNKLKS